MATYVQQLEAKCKALERILKEQKQEILDLHIEIEMLRGKECSEEDKPVESSNDKLKIAAIDTYISKAKSVYSESAKEACASNVFDVAMSTDSDSVKLYAIDAINKISKMSYSVSVRNKCIDWVHAIAC